LSTVNNVLCSTT